MTIDRAGNTASGLKFAPRLTLLLASGLAAVFLAGCESSNLLSSSAPETAVVTPPPAAAQTRTVAVYPVLAAPDPLNKQLQAEVVAAIDKTRFRPIAVTDSTTPAADYHLRGYATASKDKAGVKFAYFFDVLDSQGQKLNRIAGEEPMPGVNAKSKDIWPGVTPEIVKSVANRAATSFASTIPAAGAAGPPVANAGPGAKPLAQAAPAAATPAAAQPAEAPVARAAVGGPLTVSITPVSGAPGDGDKALTAALAAELRKKGLTVVEGQAPATYNVQGKVTTSATEQGSEQVKIAWDVKDGAGNRMATVSQGNTVEKGSLNGTWGATASDIAAAATAAILPLLKKPDAAAAPVPGRQASAASAQVQ